MFLTLLATIRKIRKIMQEEKLIAGLKVGDSRAVSEWFSLYYTTLVTVASTKISSRQDAEEVVQECFLNCLKQIGLFRSQSSLLTWMNAILRHEISDYYRKKYAKKALQTLPLLEKIVAHPVHDSHAVSHKVTHVLTQMRAEYRELLLQKYVDALRVKDIALEKGRSCKAVESDLFRAREEFRSLWLLEKST